MPIKEHAKNPQNWGIGAIIMYLLVNGYISDPKASQTPTNDNTPTYVTMPQVEQRLNEKMEVWNVKFEQIQKSLDKIDRNVERHISGDRQHSDATKPSSTNPVLGIRPDVKSPVMAEVIP